MKLSKLPILLLAVVVLAGGSCNRDDYNYGNKDFATLSFALSANSGLNVGTVVRADDGKEITIAEALGVESYENPIAENFTIIVKNKDDEDAFNETSLLSAWDTAKKLPLGTYTVLAEYDLETVGFYGVEGGAPAFEGSAEFSIIEAKEYSVSIPVKLSNSILKVVYTDMFRKYFKAADVRAKSNGVDTEILFGYTESVEPTAQGAFMMANKAAISYAFTPAQAQGVNIQGVTGVVEESLAARTCYTLTFDVENVGGVNKFTIKLNDEVKETVDLGEVDLNDDQYKDNGEVE